MTATHQLLNNEQAAEYLGIKPQTLRIWRTRNRGRYSPRFFRVGKCIRYRKADLEAWLETRAAGGGPAGDNQG